MKHRLYINYSSSRSGRESKSNEPYSNREDEYREVEFHGIYRNSPDAFFYDSREVSEEVFNSDKVYMVVVRYESGDTFGRTFGNWHIFDIFATEKEADHISGLIENDKLDGYVRWKGYFERFQWVEIHEFKVNQDAPSQNPNRKFIRH